jgi:hypothetical protein
MTSWRLNGELDTAAVTAGRDVFFRRGSYQPGTLAGQQLIDHELQHAAGAHPASSRIQAAVIDDERVRVEAERKYRRRRRRGW